MLYRTAWPNPSLHNYQSSNKLLCRSCELDPETCNPELKIASSIYKRNPYGFGLGKRDPYAFGLGKRSTLTVGLGKREPYAFGLGKRSSNMIQPFMMMAPGNEESQKLCLTKRGLFGAILASNLFRK